MSPARRYFPPTTRPPARRVPHDQRRYVLSPQEVRFVEEYLIDLDHRGAAARVGLPPARGSSLLASPRVQEAISLAKRRRASRTQIYGDYAVQRVHALATADPREIVEIRRVNCRHCHGIEHAYQFRDLEYRQALSEHRAAQDRLHNNERVPFDELGGAGFKGNAPPNPDCPNCDGEGVLSVLVKDSRNYSPNALLLFDGLKYGAGGSIEVKFRDRSWAEGMLLRHAGALNDRAPIEVFDVDRMTPDQLDAVVTSAVERGIIEYEELDEPEDPSITDAESEDVV